MRDSILEIRVRYSSLTVFQQKLILVAGLALLADFLFFGFWPGISIVIFVIVLAITLVAINFRRRNPASIFVAVMALFASILPVVEVLNMLSLMFALIGIATFSLWMTQSMKSVSDFSIWHPVRLLINSPFYLPIDIKRTTRYAYVKPKPGRLSFDWRGWVIPVFFSIVFIVLLVGANPVFEQIIKWLFDFNFDFENLVKILMHALLWTLAAALSWAFLRRHKLYEVPDINWSIECLSQRSQNFLETRNLIRSLILFNLIFAIHTVSDALYLWGGAQLPDGLTYAQYAHRGTYSLLATAVLAALFVLVSMGPRNRQHQPAIIHQLVYLWIAQTVVMIISALYRLNLYVAHYSLTHARVIAFFLIGFVGIGLVLIVVQIAKNKPNRWLVNANAGVLTLMLYCFSVTNFDYIIAKYNIDHSYEISGNGQTLDMNYIRKLGIHALPPLLENQDQLKYKLRQQFSHWHFLVSNGYAELRRTENWRSWGFRDWRLKLVLRDQLAIKYLEFSTR